MYFLGRQSRYKAESSHEKCPLRFPRTPAYMRVWVKDQARKEDDKVDCWLF